MAGEELELTFNWENTKSFQMTAKKTGKDVLTVIKMDENGQIDQLWPHLENICKQYLDQELKAIGKAMKKP